MKEIETILKEIKGKRILVIGDVMLDHYIWGHASRLASEAPVPLIGIDKENYVAGGAANVALNLKELGVSPTLVGTLGRDAAGNRLAQMLQDAGVSLDYRFTQSNAQTITKIRVLAQHRHLFRLDREDKAGAYKISPKSMETFLEEKISHFEAVILSDHAKGVLENDVIDIIRKICSEKNIFLSCDPKLRRRRDFKKLDLLILSLAEANSLVNNGDEDLLCDDDKLCEKIFKRWSPKHLIITLGKNGMLYAEEGKVKFNLPTFGIEVHDDAGVGDTIISMLTAAIISGASMKDAVYLSNMAAGVVVSKLGTVTASPREILEHIKAHS